MKKILLLIFTTKIVVLFAHAQWNELGGANSFQAHNSIFAVCADKAGNIYAAGAFANGVNNSGSKYVAKFDGNTWSELGGSNSLSANSSINALCTDAQGNIYAAGDFTNSNGKRYVAKWNGSSWTEVGGLNALAANNSIRTLCSDADGNIYAAGDFTNGINNSGKRYVAKWDGSTWSEVGGLNALSANSYITSICADKNGNLYAAGGFTNSSDYRYVAEYTGGNWFEMTASHPLNANSVIYALCTDAQGNVYAAGAFTNAVGKQYVARYTTDWGDLGSPNGLSANNYIYTLCSDPSGNIYAAGDFTIYSDSLFNHNYVAKYNGSAWSELGQNNFGYGGDYIYSVCSDAAGNIYAGGSFLNSLGNRYVARYPAVNIVPSVSIGDKNMLEGNSATTAMKFKVTLSSTSSNKITVKYTTADSTAKAGSDYIARTGTVTFNPGEASKTISVFIYGDTLVEPTEKLKVLLSKATNATIADSIAIGTIRNDDLPAVAASGSAAQKSGMVDKESHAIMLYPNPAKSSTILKTDGVGKWQVTLTDLSGKKIWSNMQAQFSSISIPLEKLPAGLYMLCASNEFQTKLFKLIKE